MEHLSVNMLDLFEFHNHGTMTFHRLCLFDLQVYVPENVCGN